MSSIFTVNSVTPTGKSDPKFGSEYYVRFNESENSFALWFKAEPEIGKEISGDIVAGKFKKEKKEWNPNPQNPQTQPTTATTPSAPASASEPRYVPYKKAPFKDNSEGQRQGMCINNAANFVNMLMDAKTVTPEVWAGEVHAYASALFTLGDLKAPEATDQENVANVFGQLPA